MSRENETITVFAGNALEANIIKGLLEDDGMTVFLKDEIIGTIAPFYAAAGGVGAVKIVVAKQDAEKARSVIKEFLNKNSDS